MHRRISAAFFLVILLVSFAPIFPRNVSAASMNIVELQGAGFCFGWSLVAGETWLVDSVSASLNSKGLITPPTAAITGDGGSSQSNQALIYINNVGFSFGCGSNVADSYRPSDSMAVGASQSFNHKAFVQPASSAISGDGGSIQQNLDLAYLNNVGFSFGCGSNVADSYRPSDSMAVGASQSFNHKAFVQPASSAISGDGGSIQQNQALIYLNNAGFSFGWGVSIGDSYVSSSSMASSPTTPLNHNGLMTGGGVSDFEISVDSKSKIGQPDSSVDYQITLISKGGFNSQITLSASFSPSPGHIGWNFNPAVITPPSNGQATSIFTVNVYSDTPLKTYTITVTATSSPISKQIVCILDAEKSLEVPYQNQADTNWCGPTSLAMILHYYGYSFHSWDYAQETGLARHDGVFLNDLKTFVDKNYSPELSTKTGYYTLPSSQAIFDDIRSNITAGYPVIVSLRHFISLDPPAHAVIVVGYNETGLFVNDPSGALFTEGDGFLNWQSNNPLYPTSFNHAYVDWSNIVQFIPTTVDISTLSIQGQRILPVPSGMIWIQPNLSMIFTATDGHVELSLDLNQGLKWVDYSNTETSIVPTTLQGLSVSVFCSNSKSTSQTFKQHLLIMSEGKIVHEFEVKSSTLRGFSYGQLSSGVPIRANSWFESNIGQYLTKGREYQVVIDLYNDQNARIDSVYSAPFYWGNPSEELVIRGLDNLLYYRSCNALSGTWDSWVNLPGSTHDSPAAAVCGNELNVVIRGVNNGQIWHSYVNLDGGSFSGWSLLTGSTPSAPTLVSNGTDLCLVALDQYGNIYYRIYDVSPKTWANWVAWPYGGTTATPAASFEGDTLHLVVKGPDGNSLWYSSFNMTSHVFSGWSYLNGGTPSSPSLTSNGASLGLVVRDQYGNIYYRFFDLATKVWGNWIAWPYGGTPEAPSATLLGSQLHIVVKGPDGNSLWHSSVNTSNGAFSGWDYVTGATPSKPTLTS